MDQTFEKSASGSGMRSLYEVIHVLPSASQDQIAASCLLLGKEFDPERNTGNTASAVRFAEVERAFETLGDPTKRAAYDQRLALTKVNNGAPLTNASNRDSDSICRQCAPMSNMKTIIDDLFQNRLNGWYRAGFVILLSWVVIAIATYFSLLGDYPLPANRQFARAIFSWWWQFFGVTMDDVFDIDSYYGGLTRSVSFSFGGFAFFVLAPIFAVLGVGSVGMWIVAGFKKIQ